MAVMVVAHPIPGFSGRVAVEEVGLNFIGGFTPPTEVPADVQAQLVDEGFTLNASPSVGYPLAYVTHGELEDPDSEPSVALRAAFRTAIDLRDWDDYDNTGNHDNRAVLAAAALQTESVLGATIFIPRGTTVIDVSTAGPVILNGGTEVGGTWASGRGGVTVMGEGKRASVIKSIGAAAALQWGSTTDKHLMGLRELSLVGPGREVTGSIGLDSYTPGGSHTYENVLIEGFDIGFREHDNSVVSGHQLNVRGCNIGGALGYYSDANVFTASRFDYCGTGVHIGYFNPARGESAPSQSHGVMFLGSLFNMCDVGALVEGEYSEVIQFLGCYFEQWKDVAIRLGPADFSTALTAAVKIDAYFNGYRQVLDPVGKVPHAIEVNRAWAVTIGGGGYRSHTSAPINVRHNEARVEVAPGRFDRDSGELGDIKLPDGTFLNVFRNRKVTVGQLSSRVSNWAAELPTASSTWDGSELTVAGVLYRCGPNGAGGWAWYAQPTAAHAAQSLAGSLTVPPAQFMVTAGTATQTNIGGLGRWVGWDMPDAVVTQVTGPIQIPLGWSKVTVDVLYTRNSGTASGLVMLGGDLFQAVSGDMLSGAAVASNQAPSTPPAAGVLGAWRALTNANVDGTKTMTARVRRLGADAGDTCTDTIQFLGLRITKTA